jgi:hypothetical protein
VGVLPKVALLVVFLAPKYDKNYSNSRVRHEHKNNKFRLQRTTPEAPDNPPSLGRFSSYLALFILIAISLLSAILGTFTIHCQSLKHKIDSKHGPTTSFAHDSCRCIAVDRLHAFQHLILYREQVFDTINWVS